MIKNMIIPTYIFDIDGTLTDNTHRLHHIETDDPDWDAFYADMYKDTFNYPLVNIFNSLFDADNMRKHEYSVVISTSRMEKNRVATMDKLAEELNNIDEIDMFFRDNDDFGPDTDVKLKSIRRMKEMGYMPIMAFEDRTDVIDMYQEQGVMTLFPGQWTYEREK